MHCRYGWSMIPDSMVENTSKHVLLVQHNSRILIEWLLSARTAKLSELLTQSFCFFWRLELTLRNKFFLDLLWCLCQDCLPILFAECQYIRKWSIRNSNWILHWSWFENYFNLLHWSFSSIMDILLNYYNSLTVYAINVVPADSEAENSSLALIYTTLQ